MKKSLTFLWHYFTNAQFRWWCNFYANDNMLREIERAFREREQFVIRRNMEAMFGKHHEKIQAK